MPLAASFSFEDVPLVEFMYRVLNFTRTLGLTRLPQAIPVSVVVSRLGKLCLCVRRLPSAINSHWLIVHSLQV